MTDSSTVTKDIIDISVADLIFLYETISDTNEKQTVLEELTSKLVENNMETLYVSFFSSNKLEIDQSIVEKMSKINELELQKLDEEIEQTKQNNGEYETNLSILKKANYLSKIARKDDAIETYKKVKENTTSNNTKMDCLFSIMLLAFFFNDLNLVKQNLDYVKSILEEGGDWDRKNKHKVYEAVYLICVRDFESSSKLFLDCLSTFTSYELMDFKTFVMYTVLSTMLVLKRKDLKTKVVEGSEILEVINNVPNMERFVNSLYYCEYNIFFEMLAYIEQNYIKRSRYIKKHSGYYIREMKIRIYSQLLEAYKSVSISSIAKTFNVTEEFIDKELSRFIATDRINCVINKKDGIVEIVMLDNNHLQYRNIIKHGDLLLNRIQKLARVINI